VEPVVTIDPKTVLGASPSMGARKSTSRSIRLWTGTSARWHSMTPAFRWSRRH